jgi:hypothetical protein
MMAMHVFVSYSRHDSDFVARLVALLEANGHDVWLDATDLRGSDEWRQSIVDAIRAADVVVLVISPRSMASNDVEREITVAAEEQRRILPVVLEHADLTGSIRYELAGVQHISFEGQPFDGAASKLLEALQAGPSATTSRTPTETTSPGSVPLRLRSLGGRAASLGMIAAAVLGLLILRLALGSGGGPGAAASGQPAQPTTAASSATAVDLDAAVWFSGFDIKVNRALLDREHRKVRVDTAFTNRQPVNADPGYILGSDITALEWNGRRFGPSCMCNPLPVSATLATTLTFDVDDSFDLAKAVLVFGGPTQHQATIPLDGEPATSEMPVSRDVSSAIPDGAGSTFTVEKIEVVPAGCTGLADRLSYLPGPKGKLSIVVFGTAETTWQYGAGFGEAYLVLPDGSMSGSSSLTGRLAVYPITPVHDIAACMTVPAPAAGTYRFVVTADGVKSKPWGFEFKL